VQVLDIQAELKELGRNDLAGVLQEVQTQEKQNLRMVSAGKGIIVKCCLVQHFACRS